RRGECDGAHDAAVGRQDQAPDPIARVIGVEIVASISLRILASGVEIAAHDASSQSAVGVFVNRSGRAGDGRALRKLVLITWLNATPLVAGPAVIGAAAAPINLFPIIPAD